MTPVFLLTDGYIANGSEPWRIPTASKELRPTRVVIRRAAGAISGDETFLPYDPR